MQRRFATGMPVGDVVRSLFISILSRPPDPAAMAFYSRALARGARVESVVRSLETSDEAGISAWRDPPARSLGPPLWAARRAGRPERQIYLLDTPGSGGDRVAAALREVAAGRVCLTGLCIDQALWVPDLLLQQASLVSGPLGAAGARWMSPDVVSVVVVSHPVERVAAHYRALTGDAVTGPPMRGVSFTAFATEPAWRPLVADLQARHLTSAVGDPGEWDELSADAGLAALERPAAAYRDLPLQALMDLSPSELSPTELGGAAAEVLERFEIVGTPGGLDTVLARLADGWGLGGRLLPVPPAGPTMRVERRLADAIVAANPADLALYERARSLA